MTERNDRLILVDTLDRPVGVADKREAHAGPILHRAFSVFLWDGTRLLLQRRADGKYHSGGLWANACCSHPRVGEELLPSAENRLQEELGMRCPLREIGSFVYFHRFAEDLFEYEYDHVLLGRYSGEFHPDAGEIAELRWVRLQELDEELRREPESFAAWFRTGGPMVLRYLALNLH